MGDLITADPRAMDPVSATPPSASPIDSRALDNLRRIGGEPASSFLHEMVQIFVEDSPPRLAEIEAASARADGTALAKAAHSLKGAGSNFGAHRFRALCEALERAGKAGEFASVATLLSSLRTEYEQVLAALRHELDKSS
jgi:HPt (histidine-containing phosphotransfer) domain-containing protein